MNNNEVYMEYKTLLGVAFYSSFTLTVQANSKQVEWDVSNVGDQINSKYHDGWSTVTEDGLTMYFGSNRPGGFVKTNLKDDWGLGADGTPTRYDMYVSHRKSLAAAWNKPVLLPAPVNSEFNDHSAAESDDGHYLFFASSRPGGCGNLDLYVSYRDDVNDDQSWQPPKNLGCQSDGGPNGAAIDSCPIYYLDEKTKDIKLYFTASTTPNPSTLDFKHTTFDPHTMTAKGESTINISTEFLDGHIDPKYGYVWGAYPTGKGGSDIWLSERNGHSDSWNKLVNLGDSINTEYEEQLPSPVKEGSVLIFPSNRPGGKGGMDIYRASKR
jgi:hypothetical protein